MKVPLLDDHIYQHLLSRMELYGDNTFACFDDQSISKTYTEFVEETTAVAAGLVDLGYKPGDKIGIWLPNYYEWLLMQFACHRIGCVVVNVNPAYKAGELAYALNSVRCKVLGPRD